jgi:hypothetical protein
MKMKLYAYIPHIRTIQSTVYNEKRWPVKSLRHISSAKRETNKMIAFSSLLKEHIRWHWISSRDRLGSGQNSGQVRTRVGSGRIGPRKYYLTSGRVIEKIFELGSGRVGSGRVGSGHKTLTDFELYVRQIAFLDKIMIVLL